MTGSRYQLLIAASVYFPVLFWLVVIALMNFFFFFVLLYCNEIRQIFSLHFIQRTCVAVRIHARLFLDYSAHNRDLFQNPRAADSDARDSAVVTVIIININNSAQFPVISIVMLSKRFREEYTYIYRLQGYQPSH